MRIVIIIERAVYDLYECAGRRPMNKSEAIGSQQSILSRVPLCFWNTHCKRVVLGTTKQYSGVALIYLNLRARAPAHRCRALGLLRARAGIFLTAVP